MVTLHSKKQSLVARSSVEAEFKAMTHGVCKMLWLNILLKEIWFDSKDSTRLYCDNKAAINIAYTI